MKAYQEPRIIVEINFDKTHRLLNAIEQVRNIAGGSDGLDMDILHELYAAVEHAKNEYYR